MATQSSGHGTRWVGYSKSGPMAVDELLGGELFGGRQPGQIYSRLRLAGDSKKGRAMAVDTKTAARRELRYDSFDDFERDLDAVEAGHKAGTLKTTGNWTPGQIMEHLAKFANCAFDGFDAMAPWPIRKMAILMFKKKMLSGEPMAAGYKLPKKAAFMLPGDEVSTDDGIGQLRAVFLRLQGGERFKAKSPMFERLDHDQWSKAQLGHAAMHMSFIDFETSDGNGADGG